MPYARPGHSHRPVLTALAACGIAALLLTCIALWIRSHYAHDSMTLTRVGARAAPHYRLQLLSSGGGLCVRASIDPPFPAAPVTGTRLAWESSVSCPYPMDQVALAPAWRGLGFKYYRMTSPTRWFRAFVAPYWFPTALAAAQAARWLAPALIRWGRRPHDG